MHSLNGVWLYVFNWRIIRPVLHVFFYIVLNFIVKIPNAYHIVWI